MTHVNDAIDYCKRIVSGEQLACNYIIKAAKRFLEDIEDTSGRWVFIPERAERVMQFAGLVNFIEGPLAGSPVILSDWQKLYFCAAYGFVDKDDHEIRKYTRIITMIGRKNAKSTLLAVHGLYEMLFAPEGSQIFSLATTKEQAKLVWNMARRMIERMDERLVKDLKVTHSTIAHEKLWNRWTPLSKESKRLDGLGARHAIVDEAAAIANRDIIEVVTSSMGAEKSPQTCFITTAQDMRDTYFYELMEHSQRVLDGHATDDRLFALLYSLDDEEEWDNPEMFVKANPNLGISVSEEFLREELAYAKATPAAKANYLIKYCNLFVSTTTVWIPRERWDINKVSKPDLSGAECYIGVDLANTQDLNAVCLLYPQGDHFYADFTCWVPQGTYKDVPKHLKQVYSDARNSGALKVQPGEIADHEEIMDYLIKVCQEQDVREISYDRSGHAVQMFTKLSSMDYPTVPHSQSMMAMSPVAKQLESHIMHGKIKHSGDSFISWQIGNTIVYTDVNDNIKPQKGEDRFNKIDATIALIMALSAAIDHGGLKPKPKFTYSFS